MQTANEIIEEKVKEWRRISNGEIIDPEHFLRSALSEAMKQAVEEADDVRFGGKIHICPFHDEGLKCRCFEQCELDLKEKRKQFFKE